MIGRMPSSELKIWDVTAGKEIRTLTLSSTPAEVSFNADGKLIATVSTQGEISLWDVASGTRVKTITGAPGANYNPAAMEASMATINPRNITRGQMPNIQMPNLPDLSTMTTSL